MHVNEFTRLTPPRAFKSVFGCRSSVRVSFHCLTKEHNEFEREQMWLCVSPKWQINVNVNANVNVMSVSNFRKSA